MRVEDGRDSSRRHGTKDSYLVRIPLVEDTAVGVARVCSMWMSLKRNARVLCSIHWWKWQDAEFNQGEESKLIGNSAHLKKYLVQQSASSYIIKHSAPPTVRFLKDTRPKVPRTFMSRKRHPRRNPKVYQPNSKVLVVTLTSQQLLPQKQIPRSYANLRGAEVKEEPNLKSTNENGELKCEGLFVARKFVEIKVVEVELEGVEKDPLPHPLHRADYQKNSIVGSKQGGLPLGHACVATPFASGAEGPACTWQSSPSATATARRSSDSSSRPDAMPLCGVIRSALSASIGAAVQILIFLLQSPNLGRVQASLPPGAEDEIILIEHLPGRRVHLQDFFWTGADDAPPWVDPNQGLTFYETRTVHHTVTVYSPVDDKGPESGPPRRPGSYDPECTTCIEPTPRLDDDEDQNIGILIGEDPGPRYWLLTVLRPGEAVPPKVELRLARLYRAAFSRQQQRHLGLLSVDPRSRRAVKQPGFVEDKDPIVSSRSKESNGVSLVDAQTLTASKPAKLIEISKLKRTLLPTSRINEEDQSESSKNDATFPSSKSKLFEEEIDSAPRSSSLKKKTTDNLEAEDTNSSIDTSVSILRANRSTFRGNESVLSESASISRKDETTSSRLRSLDQTTQEIVQVRMQNTSVIEGGATRLIYSVHLGGKPVPAESAARDMALLSAQEVALELGAPVIIQSEPYLKESRPLALSRKRDAWLLIGAASAGILLLVLVVVGLILAAKRKRALSAVVAPPNRSILKKEREYVPTTPALDNAAFSTSETEAKTDGTSQRQTPGSLSRTPITPETPDSLNQEVSSENEEELKGKALGQSHWETLEQPAKKPRLAQGRISRTNAIDPPRTPDSMDSAVDHMETLESLEHVYARQEEATASPHSYLSMPSCKQFPSMRSVEPLSRVLEPVMVRHLDIDSPEVTRRDNGHVGGYKNDRTDAAFLTRASSASKDPGVVGPIVWNLRKQGLSAEGNLTSETDLDVAPAGPVGRARRRLHELLEDSFSLFGSRDPKFKESLSAASRPTSAAYTPDVLAVLSEGRGRSADLSPEATPTTEVTSRPRTSLPLRGFQEDIPETGHAESSQPRGAWGSRPLSAGPFHRPNLPEVDTRRILTDCQLPLEDPAVPLIASIKRELERFSP
ncbi:hypothetical protein KM043_003459 [Ampulex compressa]|nr:hypothetical protein KM043_003459 [Ampulex compressa]